MNDPTPIEYPAVLESFRDVMDARLHQNLAHKGDRNNWVNGDVSHLLERVAEELQELREAVELGHSEVLLEAADVANMAMMVADCYDPEGLDPKSRRPSQERVVLDARAPISVVAECSICSHTYGEHYVSHDGGVGGCAYSSADHKGGKITCSCKGFSFVYRHWPGRGYSRVFL
jgi:NTP pyrophosphatase (non-canonical NTP hydrolase)